MQQQPYPTLSEAPHNVELYVDASDAAMDSVLSQQGS
ncbi:hypothetical protein EGR_10827 [Echinococcus granulosus]|uniref:Uncharacterized protein n=1 Tax=Echinococcus granulosus TaxID=6210 RepID=W6U1D5_ECHGR|nr:hypothetical protein EGR_10827 [Echinococcus granulosus]EUB54316.1 hypothetical protein EGR_10827 [Echinococcus granulosus]